MRDEVLDKYKDENENLKSELKKLELEKNPNEGKARFSPSVIES